MNFSVIRTKESLYTLKTEKIQKFFLVPIDQTGSYDRVRVQRKKGEKKMFKTLLQKIIEINTTADLNNVCSEIDMAYQKQKISFKDHEMLFNLIRKHVIKSIVL